MATVGRINVAAGIEDARTHVGQLQLSDGEMLGAWTS